MPHLSARRPIARRTTRLLLAGGVATAVAFGPAATALGSDGPAVDRRRTPVVVPAATHRERGQLDATAALSPTDVWSVGGTDQPGHSHGSTLVEHWDGTTWTRVESPDSKGSVVSNLDSVSAVSAKDVWAVGTGATEDGSVRALVEHWDGTAWTVVKAPDNPASNVNYLQAVSADAADDVWIAADYTNAEGVWIPYVERWNGRRWSIVPVPQPKGSLQTFLTGAFALSATDVWIVGQCIDSSGTPVALTEHWNGRRWSVVPAPSPKQAESSGFAAVSGTSGSDVWAVGNATTSAGSTPSLTEHWNGHRWSIVASPNGKGKFGSPLTAVSADPAGDVWAVGDSDGSAGRETTFALCWTGTAWTAVATPNGKAAQATMLNGVSVTSATDAWATGSSYTSSGAATAINLHWNGRRWTVSH